MAFSFIIGREQLAAVPVVNAEVLSGNNLECAELAVSDSKQSSWYSLSFEIYLQAPVKT